MKVAPTIPESIDHSRSQTLLAQAFLPHPQLGALTFAIGSFYEVLEGGSFGDRAGFIKQILARGEKFAQTASSVTIGAALSAQAVHDLISTIAASNEGVWISNRLGSRVAIDLDQSWVRRQYAPGRYPAFHAPHGWHQDGALGANFMSIPCPCKALLEMVTIWIALNPCGIDAPGLELVTSPVEQLLRPEQLIDSCVRTRFADDLYWKPVLSPGDALLFSGAILHRTHVLAGMRQDRTSIELRCFPAGRLPSRLKGDRFISVS